MRFHLIQTGLGLGEGEWEWEEKEGNPPSASAIFPNFSVSTNRPTTGRRTDLTTALVGGLFLG